MDLLQKIQEAFEIHSPEIIRECFTLGISPNATDGGKSLFMQMVNMYLRSPRFKDCIQAFVDHGLVFQDKVLLAVLLDDDRNLENYLTEDQHILQKKYTLECTFTPMTDVSLLHICAEYNHVKAAKVLVEHGADINSKAGTDENGFGGHTPIFHTVNQHNNACLDMLKFLLDHKADLDITVRGLIWGKGYDWETYVPAVNPISYAMMGLLRQFQRTEADIYTVVAKLQKAAHGIEYYPKNIPNKYLLSA